LVPQSRMAISLQNRASGRGLASKRSRRSRAAFVTTSACAPIAATHPCAAGFANRQNTKPRTRRGWVREADADQADTTLIVRRFLGPFTENCTLPSVSANKV